MIGICIFRVMAELKHTLTLDDSEFKKKMADANKLAAQSSQKLATETNKAINEENVNRKKVVQTIEQQVQAAKALKLEITKQPPSNAFTGPTVTPANVARVKEIAEAEKFYSEQISKTVATQKTQTVAHKTNEVSAKASQRSIESLKIQLASYQAVASKAVNPAIMEQYNRKIQETEQEIRKMTNSGKAGFDSMGNAIKRSSGFVQSLKANFTALLGALGFTTLLFELVALGKELFTMQKQAEGVELAFAKIGNPAALADLRTAVRGTVSDLELMKLAVRADNFKIPMDVLGKGLAFARQRAQDTGKEVDYLVNSFVDGIGRRSVLVLDNLGISATELRAEVARVGDFAEAVGNIMERTGTQGEIALELLDEKTNKWAATWANLKRDTADFFSDIFSGPKVNTDNITQIVADQQKALEGFEKWDEERLAREIERREKHAKELQKQFLETNRETTIAEFRAYRDSLTGLEEAGTVSDFITKKKNALYEANAAEVAIVKDLKAVYDELVKTQRQSEGLYTPEELKDKIEELQGVLDQTFDPSAIKELNSEIKKYEAILDRILGKENKEGRNKSYEEREALLEKISRLEEEYNRKSLSDDEAEIQAVRDKFANLAQEIKKFNDDPDNKVKIDVTQLDSIRDKAIADLRYKQDTAALKAELEIQKDLYRDFEQFRDEFGQEAANERYGKLLDLEKSHLSRLQDEIAALESKEGLTAGESERLTMLQDFAEKELSIQRDKYDKLLGGILTFNEKRQVLEERHAREIAELGTTSTDEQLSQLRKKHNAELSDLREDFRKEYTKELSGINSKEDLAKGLAEISKFRIDKETELNRKLLNIGIKAARERIAVLEREEKDLGVDNRNDIEREEQFIARSENHLDHLTKNYLIIGKELGALLASSSDDFVAKIGRLIGEISGSITQISTGESEFAKAQGWVGLILAVGKEGRRLTEEALDQEINHLREITLEVANRISLEAKINKLYRERSRLEDNNIFLGVDFATEVSNALEDAQDATKTFEDSMTALLEDGLLSARGTAKKSLIGSKSDEYSFLIDDLLSGIEGYMKAGKNTSFWQLFTSGVDERVAKDSFNKIYAAIEETLGSMGKTIEDFNKMSSAEMLDFFTLMEEGGYVTDEGTRNLIANAQEALRVMQEAQEAIKGVIDTLAGDLGTNLRTALVEAFKAGEDAGVAMGKAVGNVLENLISQMLFDQIFRESFNKLQKEMQESLGMDEEGNLVGGGDSDLTDDIFRFYEQAGKNAEAYNAALQAAKDAAKEQGLDILGGAEEDKQESPLVGAIKGITADQADLLAGQFAGMRLANLEMLELDKVRNGLMAGYSEQMTDQLATLNLIVFNTGATATNTARLESIEVTLKSMNNKMNSSANAVEASGLNG